MNKIKFSHRYNKLRIIGFHGEVGYISRTRLLEVIPVNLEDLHRAFIAYDTDIGKYKLPNKGKYMLLIFSKGGKDIFTTIRRFTPQKYEYYKCERGEMFEVVIDE